jgi:hypothetical protein
MCNQDLIDKFQRCEQWQDADQWDALGMLYFQRGFMLNAGVCFQRADACRLKNVFSEFGLMPVAVETGEK